LDKPVASAHPGEVLLKQFLRPRRLKPSQLAGHFGFAPNRLTRVVNGEARINAELAILLAEAFDTTAEFWLTLQARYDLHQARQIMPGFLLEQAIKLRQRMTAGSQTEAAQAVKAACSCAEPT
jgi:antitoxin HigA-1